MKRINWEMDKGRSATWLAEQLDLSVSLVSRMLRGERKWRKEYLEKAGRVLGVMPDDLLVEVEPCGVCGGYGTRMVEQGGKRFVMVCDAEDCEGGCVPVEPEPEAVDEALERARVAEREAVGGGEWEDD